MPVLGEPDAAALEPVDERVERPAAAEEDTGNEEFSLRFEQEERPVAIGPQPVAMLLDEAQNLTLREAEAIRVGRDRTEHLGEGGVARQLVHRDRSCGRGPTGLIRAPPDEIRVNAAGEHVFGGEDELGAVGLVDDQGLPARDEAEDGPRFGLDCGGHVVVPPITHQPLAHGQVVDRPLERLVRESGLAQKPVQLGRGAESLVEGSDGICHRKPPKIKVHCRE